MGKQDRFTDEFKRDAVAQVVDRGYPVREVAERLGISTKSIYTWQRLDLQRFCSGQVLMLSGPLFEGHG